ncbi:ATP-binding protein [Catellatospora vulcania]|uniref:ATP-binding protein n=1 Tax=Catellatospora vulcania TaxID=1460450 RepID=UPI0018AFEAFF|nr:ATP-binding protein [Catellatospora vulcania]
MRQLTAPFEPCPRGVPVLSFDSPTDLAAVREFVCECARAVGLPADRLAGLSVAISEVATNTLRHTCSGGTVRVWADLDTVISELTDSGTFDSSDCPAEPGSAGGWGLRIADEVCDRFDLYSCPGRTVWRLVISLNVG